MNKLLPCKCGAMPEMFKEAGIKSKWVECGHCGMELTAHTIYDALKGWNAWMEALADDPKNNADT